MFHPTTHAAPAASAQFAPGQAVIADGRHAHVAFADATGTYVYTPAGIVRAYSVHTSDLGAPRQLQAGAPCAQRRVTPSVGPRRSPSAPIARITRIFPLRSRAA